MSTTLRISCFQAEGPGDPGRFQDYEVPLERETSLQDLLVYISENLDPTLAFYKHAACRQGLCGECNVRLNGRAALACTAPVRPEVLAITVEPYRRDRVIRDLLCHLT
jgi:succinate dehydrogenase / fumarate reductase iron-sulfur subunit